ncbi:MAG: serine hydrolase domain-containing protein [Pseudonocardia sp.]
MTTTVQGICAARFGAVRDAFVANFATQGEVGAAVCVYHRGSPVVDLWGGVADVRTGAPWTRDTLQYVFSTTKGFTAACAHLLAARGRLDLDAPTHTYWPEFAAAGKRHIPVRWLLAHRAGLTALDEPVQLADALRWHPMAGALAAQRPVWEPGSAHGYHAQTFGWLVGEVVRRVSGSSIGRFLAEEIAAPLGLDFHIGLPDRERHRLSRLVEPPPSARTESPGLRRASAVTVPPIDPQDPRVHAAQIPSSNGIGTARAIARFYAALVGEVDGIRILGPADLDRALVEHSAGVDLTLGYPTRFASGFALPSAAFPLLGAGSFGHGGKGGSTGCAHPPTGVAVGYVMNRMRAGVSTDTRFANLARAIRASM